MKISVHRYSQDEVMDDFIVFHDASALFTELCVHFLEEGGSGKTPTSLMNQSQLAAWSISELCQTITRLLRLARNAAKVSQSENELLAPGEPDPRD